MDQSDRFFQIIPPTVSGEHQVVSTASAAAAANWNWVTALGTDAPKGTVYVVLEAVGQDCYVRFKATGAAGTTATNGLLIKADQPGRPFWVDPVLHPIIDVLAGAAGTIKLQVASKIGARRDV